MCYTASGVFATLPQPLVVHGPGYIRLLKPDHKTEFTLDPIADDVPYANRSFDLKVIGYGLNRLDLYTIISMAGVWAEEPR